MKHPFKTGKKYRNRHDEYEVINLEYPEMTIRYSDGNVLETTVEIQARIWRNIQMEEDVAEQRQAKIRARRRRKLGGKFDGLQDHDFQSGVKGTHWRARTGLGGFLVRKMLETTEYKFQSYAINPWPEVQIAQPIYYEKKKKVRQRTAKFTFALNEQHARYGFHVRRDDGPMDERWDWLRFFTALKEDSVLQQEIEALMHSLELHWDVYIHGTEDIAAQVKMGQEDMAWEWQDRDESESLSWPDEFTEKLDDVKVSDLYLCTYMDKEEALEAGMSIVEPVTEIYRQLLPLYMVSTRRFD